MPKKKVAHKYMDRQAQITADLEAYRASKQTTPQSETQTTVKNTGNIQADLEAYRASKAQTPEGVPVQEASDPQVQTEKPSFSSNEKLGDEVRRRREEIKGIQQSDQKGASKLLQQGGQVAGLAGSLATRGLSAITPNFIERPIAGAIAGIGKGVASLPVAQKVGEKYGQFAEKHPEAAANLGAVGEIASLVPEVSALTGGATIGKNVVTGAFKQGVKGLEKAGLKSAADEVVTLVSPKLSEKATISAIKTGKATKTGLLGKVELAPEARTIKAADAVRDVVDPSKTITENVNSVRTALTQEAQNLKSAIEKVDHPYVFRELQSRLRKVQKPISVKANNIWNKQFDLVQQAAMDISKQKGGKVSSLLEARKAFDDLVESEIPNLYSASETPMKEAIKKIRREMNEFINDNLPEGSGFKESLAKQSSMYDAIDGMASKAAGEIGTNMIERTSQKIPGVLKDAARTTAAGGLLKTIGILD